MADSTYVLAEHKNRQELVRGDFYNMAKGNLFNRDPAIYGQLPWTITKVFDHEQQQQLQALEHLIGFESLSALFAV